MRIRVGLRAPALEELATYQTTINVLRRQGLRADLLKVEVQQVPIDRVEVRALDLVCSTALRRRGEARRRRGHLLAFARRRRRCERSYTAGLLVRRLRERQRRRCGCSVV